MSRSAFAVVLVVAAGAFAADWPQFQGPDRSGVSPETHLADAWPAEGPKVVWKIDGRLGTGFGGPVVQAGKVYLLDRVKDQRDVLRCIDLKTGREEWTFSYECPPGAMAEAKLGRYKGNYNGSRNLPAVGPKNVYILGPFGNLHAVSKKTHRPLWARNIITEYGADLGNWGLCQSPVLYKDTVIVAPLSGKAGVVAFDRMTGREVWKSDPIGQIAWTSPMIATVDGVDQVVMLHTRGAPRLTGLDAATGKVLWVYRGWKLANPIASQIHCGQGRFFLTGGYGAGCVMVKVSRTGRQWRAEELFRSKSCGSQAQNPILYKGYIYANSNNTKSGVMCLDLAGRVKWKTANDNPEEIGSILIADGKIYSLLSEQGVLRLIQASPAGHKELAKAKITRGRNIWGPMALSEGKLLVRNRRTLICLDVKGD